MSEQNTHDQAWSIWVNVILLIASAGALATAGPMGMSGNEVGAGFFPKIAAIFLSVLVSFNLIVALRAQAPVSIVPRTVLNVIGVVVLGFLGMVIFQQIGLAIALFFLLTTLLVASERKFIWQHLVIALVSTIIFHGFFVGFLGIFDPAGNLVDLRWITPW